MYMNSKYNNNQTKDMQTIHNKTSLINSNCLELKHNKSSTMSTLLDNSPISSSFDMSKLNQKSPTNQQFISLLPQTPDEQKITLFLSSKHSAFSFAPSIETSGVFLIEASTIHYSDIEYENKNDMQTRSEGSDCIYKDELLSECFSSCRDD